MYLCIKCNSEERKRKEKNPKQSTLLCLCVCVSSTNPKIRSSKAVGGGNIGGGCCVGVEGIDIGQQGAHHCRDSRTHVLRRQTGKVPA